MSRKFSRRLRTFKEWILPFSTAWELLLDIPFPKSLKSQDEAENSAVLMSFPLVGAFLGILGYVLARFFLAFLGNFAASVVFSILFAAFLEFITKCRNLSIFSSFAENRFDGISTYDSFMNLNDNFNNPSFHIQGFLFCRSGFSRLRVLDYSCAYCWFYHTGASRNSSRHQNRPASS